MFGASKTASVSTGGYQISRSLRFNSADSAYLNRTFSAGNQKTWTYSCWFKRGRLTGTDLHFFDGSTAAQWWFDGTTCKMLFYNGSTSGGYFTTNQVFRDPSAWYHLVLAYDTTQATDANKMLFYINGVLQSISVTNYPTTNYDGTINSAISHQIGSYGAGSQTFDGLVTEVNFVGGQALTPSSFGATDAQTGVWGPVAYSGSYGTNGFYLNFSDNSNTTAATLGKDYSGNGNNWTPNNFSVTAGAGNDSLVDSPTSYGTDTGVGGTVRGNYATWNALTVNKPTLTNGNLDADGSDLKVAISTMGVSSGKWYWEITIGSGTNTPNMGITAYANDNADPGVYNGVGRSFVSGGGGGGVYKAYTATSTTANSAFSNANTAGATIGFALNCDAGTLAYYVNNTLGYTDSTVATGTLLYPMTTNFNSAANNYRNTSLNTGQRPFAYTAPSGFKALCTQNLPTPTIGATTATTADKFFTPVIYTGTGSTQSITSLGFQPDWTWIKSRSYAEDHMLVDAVRGTGAYLFSNLANAEVTGSTTRVTSFNSNGFSLGTSTSVNTNAATYVAWNWKANGSGSTNTSGSITSTVSANTTSGFSIVTYTGQSGAGTVGHGLGVAPSMIIVKSRSNGTYGWAVWHSSLTQNEYLLLNAIDAKGTAANYWNSSAPSTWTSAFGVGSGPKYNNNSGDTFVAYCFAAIAGFSAFGSYTGNGSSDGPFIYTGFRPAYLLIKFLTGTTSWMVLDNPRSSYFNVAKNKLYPDLASAEDTSAENGVDLVSNGFKIRTGNNKSNDPGATYIYVAFAENPFKYSLAR